MRQEHRCNGAWVIVIRPLSGFTEDGKAAIAASPNYFLAWYSAKSIMLVGAIGFCCYLLGKSKR